MTPPELKRFKGILVKGPPVRTKRPKQDNNVFYDDDVQRTFSPDRKTIYGQYIKHRGAE